MLLEEDDDFKVAMSMVRRDLRLHNKQEYKLHLQEVRDAHRRMKAQLTQFMAHVDGQVKGLPAEA